MYKCKDCSKQFIGGQRRDKSQVITDYVEGKQTLLQLASKYKVSERTIRRDLEVTWTKRIAIPTVLLLELAICIKNIAS